MSDSLDEWISTAVPAGSGRYYALLHSDQTLQQQQKLIATLISVFSKLGFQSREIEVASHKLNWWRNELCKERFDHPVTSALASVRTGATHHSGNQPQVDRVKQLLEGYGSLLEKGSPSKPESHYQQFHLATGAVACQLICNTDKDEPVVNDVGVVLSRVRCYRYLRQHVDSGLLCLPITALDAAQVSPAELTIGNTDAKVQSFLSSIRSELLHDMHQAQTALNSHVQSLDRREDYKALYIYLQLQIRLLARMERDKVSVLDETTRLTPLSNYWCAFKAARQFDRIK